MKEDPDCTKKENASKYFRLDAFSFFQCFSASLSRFLTELCPGGDGVVEHEQVQLLLAVYLAQGGQQHAV